MPSRRHSREDRRPPRRVPGDRRARRRRAARLPGGHGRRPAARPAADRTRPASRRRRSRRSTRTSTRSAAAPTGPAGRSAGRSTSARSTPSSRASAGPSWSRTSGCSAPTRSPASAARRSSASSWSRTRWSSPTSTRCWSRAPECAGSSPGWARPHPLGAGLPALYQEDDFAQRLHGRLRRGAGADLREHSTTSTAYLDPATRAGRLPRLARGLGRGRRSTRPGRIERRRELVADAAELYRSRGTVAGLAAQVAIYTGGDVDVEDNGAAAWSADTGRHGPGHGRRRCSRSGSPSTIRMRSASPGSRRWWRRPSRPTCRTRSRSSGTRPGQPGRRKPMPRPIPRPRPRPVQLRPQAPVDSAPAT